MLAFAEVSEFVAQQRDEIYQTFYDETRSRIRDLDPTMSEQELQTRSTLVMAMLEGLHAVTAFRPDIMGSSTDFPEQLVSQVKAIAYGRVT